MTAFQENLLLRRSSVLGSLNRFRDRAPYMYLYFGGTIFMVTGQSETPLNSIVRIGSKVYTYQTTIVLANNLESQVDAILV